jgi:uncharacterized ferritin-like protein (DUF455 family)
VRSEVETNGPAAPRAGTLERWAFDYVTTTSLEEKLHPGPPPADRDRDLGALRIAAPGRPPILRTTTRRQKTPGPEAIRDPKRRAELLHVFAHHELQAAELFAWTILAFPESPDAFLRGLAAIVRDEARHLGMYAEHLARLGHPFGSFPVRDWFWERVPSVRTATELVALMGLGFEGANLDHTSRFGALFRAVGDDEAARLTDVIGHEEIPHVRFAARWFRTFTGALDFESFRRALPPPLSPLVLRGRPIDRARRLDAGMPLAMIETLDAWQPDSPSS